MITGHSADSLPPEPVRPSSDVKPSRPFPIDSQYIAPMLITVILLIGQAFYGFLESYPKTLLAIGTSILAEILLSRLFYNKWPSLASAYVTGISVGILVRSPLYWPFAMCSALSIASKYVLRINGRHLWNPSNFGVSAMLFLAPAVVASLSIQWGNALGAMLVIWTLGSIIVWRLRRFHICATYVASFFAFAALRAALPHPPLTFWETFQSEIAPITGPMYQLFIFFMITDPKSTVRNWRGQCAVAFSIAAAECVLRLFHNVHAPYFALFLVGPLANTIEIWKTRGGPNTAPSA
ncbi:hypothetical protein CCAX7_13950 [Capsulimonas corticalis]|uniref:Uncharacterized protein n=1 Tax=Capsulimonas corticalis TaxID=2219043 RepID=A0A402D6S0_9BACT|nr:hypothetical protein [Capsulimonas corticalis]BDI29344.1 hypothetical protein CCAX7_13950 [Capsulimonas corticalis]